MTIAISGPDKDSLLFVVSSWQRVTTRAARAQPMGQSVGLSGSPDQQRIRLLCLSGHASKREVTECQALHLQLEAHGCDLSYLDGPFQVSEPFDPALLTFLDAPFYTWSPPSVDDRYDNRSDLRAGVKHVLKYIARYGPFDGILGFSMGALIATLASDAMMRSPPHSVGSENIFGGSSLFSRARSCLECFRRPPQPWRFVVALCGACLNSVGDLKVSIPSLHLIGAQDRGRQNSRRLATTFVNPSTYEMSYAGHNVPAACLSDQALNALIRDFFKRVRAGTLATDSSAQCPAHNTHSEPLVGDKGQRPGCHV